MDQPFDGIRILRHRNKWKENGIFMFLVSIWINDSSIRNTCPETYIRNENRLNGMEKNETELRTFFFSFSSNYTYEEK